MGSIWVLNNHVFAAHSYNYAEVFDPLVHLVREHTHYISEVINTADSKLWIFTGN